MKYGPDHILTLRARLSLASNDLPSIVAGLRKVGKQGVPYLAQALERLGMTQLGVGDVPAALASLRECVMLRESSGIQDWELGEARERLGEALAASGDKAAASESLKQAETLLTAQLGPDHPETVRARAALSR